MIRFLCLIISLLSVSSICTGQGLPIRHFTTADGLPHLQVRDVYVDQHGFVWIATLGGIGIYDGKEIIEFRNVKELSEVYLEQVVLVDNRVIYTTEQYQIYAIQGNEVIALDSQENVRWVPLGSDGSHYFVNSRDSVFRIEGDSLIFAAAIPEEYKNGILYQHLLSNNSISYILRDSNLLIQFVPNSDSFSIRTYASKEKIEIHALTKGLINTPEFDFATFDKQLHPAYIYSVSEDSVVCVAAIDKDIGKLKKIHPAAPEYSYAISYGPVYHLNGEYYEEIRRTEISNVFGFAELEDRTLFGTDAGFFVIFKNGLEEIPLSHDNYVWSAVPLGSDLVLNSHSGDVVVFDSSGQEFAMTSLSAASERIPNGLLKSFLSNFATDGKVIVYGGFNGPILLDDNEELTFIGNIGNVEGLAYSKEHSTFFLGSNALFTFDAPSKTLTQLPGSKHAVESLTPLNDLEVIGERIWIGGNSGVGFYSLIDSSGYKIYPSKTDYPCKIAVSLSSFRNRLIVGGSCGLHIHDPATDKFTAIHPEVLERRINQLIVTNDELLVAVLSDHIYVMDLSQEDFPIIAHMDPNSGLFHMHEPSENGASLVDNRFVYIPHSSGLVRIDLDVIRQKRNVTYPATIPYLRVREGNRELMMMNDDPLRLDKNSAEFLPMLTFNFGLNWRFRVRKNAGGFTTWSQNNKFLIDNLNHGKNKITFQAVDHTGRIVEKVVTVHAWEPFWKRSQTQYGLLVLILSLLSGLALLRFQYVRRMGRYRRDLDQNRLKAIQSIINPHFLFNALTSLQYSILNKPRTESNNSLLSLSRTFRTLIADKEEHAHGSKVITLSQELDLVRDFSNLFNMQYELEKIDVIIDVDSRIDPDAILVPQLLIEPFVENALKHAFPKSSKNKKVFVKINQDGQSLLIEVVDHGKGFNPDDAKSDESMGLKLSQERFELLRKLGFSCTLEIRSEIGEGTAVLIKYQIGK